VVTLEVVATVAVFDEVVVVAVVSVAFVVTGRDLLVGSVAVVVNKVELKTVVFCPLAMQSPRKSVQY